MVEILAAPIVKRKTEEPLLIVCLLWSALASMKTSKMVSIVVLSATFRTISIASNRRELRSDEGFPVLNDGENANLLFRKSEIFSGKSAFSRGR
ncbi:hypothetical protein [Terasakiella sp. A23]|uniref:hypothetical protein n=1 Tax=Terasakiella sp. FCG-A23 TaxID=3080561 RepID=UPI002952D065|nr:hypothetical protein [Terasakiella sp. A23]